MPGAKVNSTPVCRARPIRLVRCRSRDALDSLACKATETPIAAPPVVRPSFAKVQHEDSKVPQVSRLELLLTARSPKPVYIPEEDTTVSHSVNKAIRLSSQWTEVQDVILHAPVLSSSNLAFTLYRLGCLSAFDSRKRRNDLKASDLIPNIFDLAMSKIEVMEPSSLVLLLDGCARLQHQPSNNNLSKIGALVRQKAATLDARQLPLVLWAFHQLNFRPGVQTAMALEKAISSRASELSPQGMALVLSGFHAAQHSPSQPTLQRLTDVIQRQLLLFKPSELAACLKSLAIMGHHPTAAFVQAVAEHTGQTSSLGTGRCSDISSGASLTLAV